MTVALVTGGAGFIGSHLCERLLAEGVRVVAVDDLSTGRLANLGEARGYGAQFTFYNVDVRAEGLRAILERHRPDVLFDLAARREERGAPDPAAEASVSVMGLLNLLEGAAAIGVRKVVYASSSAVYGHQRRLPVREAAVGTSRPTTAGGIGKKLAEDHLRFYERYRGLDYTILVIATVFGPRRDPDNDPGAIGAFARSMLLGEQPVIFGDGGQTRDFVFVDDVVHALALAVDRGSGRTVNVGTGVETSVTGVCRLLADLVGFRGEPRHAPPTPGEPRRMVLDIGAAEQEIGWRPWTHLEDGLAETVSSLRDYV